MQAEVAWEGLVREPTDTDIQAWANYPIQSALEGLDLDGGWEPGRSIVPSWGGGDYYYKAGSGGDFDMFLTDTTLTPEVVDELYENKARMHELLSTYEARLLQNVRAYHSSGAAALGAQNVQNAPLTRLVEWHLAWSASTTHAAVSFFGAR